MGYSWAAECVVLSVQCPEARAGSMGGTARAQEQHPKPAAAGWTQHGASVSLAPQVARWAAATPWVRWTAFWSLGRDK